MALGAEKPRVPEGRCRHPLRSLHLHSSGHPWGHRQSAGPVRDHQRDGKSAGTFSPLLYCSALFFLKRETAETWEQPGGRQEECWPRLGCDSAGKQFLGRVHPAGLGSGLSGAPGWLCLLPGPTPRAPSLLLWACHPRLLAPEPVIGSAQGGPSFCVVFDGFGLET